MDTSAPKELVSDINGVLLSDCNVQKYVKAIRDIEEKDLDKNVIVDSVQQYSVSNMTKKCWIYMRICLRRKNFEKS